MRMWEKKWRTSLNIGIKVLHLFCNSANTQPIQPIPEPDLKPELFGQIRPEVKKPYSSGPGQEGSGQEWRSRF